MRKSLDEVENSIDYNKEKLEERGVKVIVGHLSVIPLCEVITLQHYNLLCYSNVFITMHTAITTSN